MKINPSPVAARLFVVVGVLITGFLRLVAAESTAMKSEILSTYVKVADALSADDLTTAQAAATELSGHAGMADQPQITEQASAVAKAADLSAARGAFKMLSLSIEPLAAGEKGYRVMTCEMANADWVQTSAQVKNPYLGKSMQTCGKPKTNNAPPAHDSSDEGHKGCDM